MNKRISPITFFLNGIEKDSYKKFCYKVYETNYKTLITFCIFTAVFMAVLSVIAFLFESCKQNFWFYVGTWICTVLILCSVVLFGKKHPRCINFLCLIFLEILFLFGIFIGAFAGSDTGATVFIVLIFALPMLFILKPKYVYCLLIISVTLFVGIEYHTKEYSIFFGDTFNAISFFFMSVFVNMFYARNRFTRLLIEYENAKLLEQTQVDSYTDKLTGFLNRRAYEKEKRFYMEQGMEDDFVFCCFDVNGLKLVNDTIGHAAGDELLKGAAACLMHSFGAYGKVFRTGGDEFIALIYADEKTLAELEKDFALTTENWSGSQVEHLSVSCGCARHAQFPELSMLELGKKADKLMYDEKASYYRREGIDRRGQFATHTALCNLYTKILKINITKDTYQIINMDKTEQVKEKGFASTISIWLKSFALSGQVYPDDVEQYLKFTSLDFLREYFKKDNRTSYDIFYRRKFGDTYKRALMEMIPADDYTPENQTLFLYVKSIDK